MYWSIYGFASEQDRNYNRNGVFGLLEIDLGTAKSEMTFSYPSGQIFSGLAVLNAHPDAPDDIADLAFRPKAHRHQTDAFRSQCLHSHTDRLRWPDR